MNTWSETENTITNIQPAVWLTPSPMKNISLDISIRQIESCCNGWSRKLQQYWLGNVQHGHVDRASENLRTWLRLALIKNDLPGASSQKAMSHSREISSNPSVFQRKIAKGVTKEFSIFNQVLLSSSLLKWQSFYLLFSYKLKTTSIVLVQIMFCFLIVRTQKEPYKSRAWIDYA